MQPFPTVNEYEDLPWTSLAELKDLAIKDSPWNFYLETEVYFETPERAGVVRPVREAGDTDPRWGPLHVISATQPGPDPDPKETATRLAILDRELRESFTKPIRWIRAVGSSFDGAHHEESRAVFGLDDDAARALGVRFGQVAIFSWNGPWWSLLACASDRVKRRPWQWREYRDNR